MSRRRLFVPAERLAGPRLTITGDDHRYVARVLRARVGDRLALFDGAGTEIDAEVTRVGKLDVELALEARRDEDEWTALRLRRPDGRAP